MEKVLDPGKEGSILVHVGITNAEGGHNCHSYEIQAVGQMIMSGILPLMGSRGQEYRNCRIMAIDALVQLVRRFVGLFFWEG